MGINAVAEIMKHDESTSFPAQCGSQEDMRDDSTTGTERTADSTVFVVTRQDCKDFG